MTRTRYGISARTPSDSSHVPYASYLQGLSLTELFDELDVLAYQLPAEHKQADDRYEAAWAERERRDAFSKAAS